MSDLEFGITMLVVGMGGTMFTLYALTWLIRGLTALCAPRNRDETPKTEA